MNKMKREEIRLRLAAIEKASNGRLTPTAVVEDARNPESPLHDQFEWDAAKAAYSYNIAQARTLITSVMVITKTETKIVESVYYVRDPNAETKEQGYVSMTTLRSDEDMARAALVDAFSAAGDHLRRARMLAAVLELEPEVDALLSGVTELRGRVEQRPVAQTQ